MGKATYNDRAWIKAKGLGGLAQDTHVKPKQETASLKGGLTWGTTISPYKGAAGKPAGPALHGVDLFGKPAIVKAAGKLHARFTLPPFSVLDARAGEWQKRKRAWLRLGIKSEVGRGGDLLKTGQGSCYNGTSTWAGPRGPKRASATPGGSPLPAADYSKRERGDGRGRPLATTFGSGGPAHLAAKFKGGLAKGLVALREAQKTGAPELEYAGQEASGTSIFDPVLCELAYRWFAPPGGLVLDPFAGGSVRGIVAGALGRAYLGIDLRPEQTAANEAQAGEIETAVRPAWVTGDSLAEIPKLEEEADFVFSCPPYADLERYSDDPRDLSTMPYEDFVAAYRAIIAAAVDKLRPDRFAAFVVGDVRDKEGFYRNFPGATVRAFERAGARLYNEAVLLTAIGSLPIRVGKQFDVSRKLGKTHQNVLVFCKGDPRKATAAIGKGA